LKGQIPKEIITCPAACGGVLDYGAKNVRLSLLYYTIRILKKNIVEEKERTKINIFAKYNKNLHKI